MLGPLVPSKNSETAPDPCPENILISPNSDLFVFVNFKKRANTPCCFRPASSPQSQSAMQNLTILDEQMTSTTLIRSCRSMSGTPERVILEWAKYVNARSKGQNFGGLCLDIARTLSGEYLDAGRARDRTIQKPQFLIICNAGNVRSGVRSMCKIDVISTYHVRSFWYGFPDPCGCGIVVCYTRKVLECGEVE